jgi:hypothetical protein
MDEKIEKAASDHERKFTLLSDIESIIIRGHILIEYQLNVAIGEFVMNKREYLEGKFSFSQKLIIANMLGLTSRTRIEIAAINKLRNQIAHSLKYDEAILDSLILRMSNIDKHLSKIKDKSAALKRIISFICGAIMASPGGTKEMFVALHQLERMANKVSQNKETKE